MRLSVIVIGCNSWHYLEKNLASLRFLLNDSQTEIIYVDNASTDDTLLHIRQLYPSILCVENAKNAGISVARNQGIRISSGEYIWFLDSDTEISQPALTAMLSFMSEHPDIGLCGCKMYGQNGQIQESCRKYPSIKGKLQAAYRIFTKKFSKSKDTLSHRKSDYNMAAKHPFEVDYVIGACQLIRKTAQEKTGFLDEKIFYGPEDADFCFRIKQAGYKVYYLPQVSIYHAYQRVSSQRVFSKITCKHFQGLAYYFWKHRKTDIHKFFPLFGSDLGNC